MFKTNKYSLISGLLLLCLSLVSMAEPIYKLVVPIEQMQAKTWTSMPSETGEWVPSGSVRNCGAWSPTPETQLKGVVFEQTRSCSQDFEQTVAFKEISDSGEVRITSVSYNTRTSSVPQTQTRIGLKPPWYSIASTFTAWVDAGSPAYTSNWTPAISTQTSNFTQTRSYTQGQEREEQKREQNADTSEIRNVDATILHTRVVNSTDTRTVVVADSGMVNDGAPYNCSVWSPEALDQTANFIQNAACTQDKVKTTKYSINGVVVKTDTETLTELTNSTRQVVVNFGIWSAETEWCGLYGMKIWTPSAISKKSGESFTQSTTCTYTKTRDIKYLDNGSEIHQRLEVLKEDRTSTQVALGTMPTLSVGCHYSNPTSSNYPKTGMFYNGGITYGSKIGIYINGTSIFSYVTHLSGSYDIFNQSAIYRNNVTGQKYSIGANRKAISSGYLMKGGVHELCVNN